MLLVDTNVIVAATDASAAEHIRCAQLLDEHRDLTVTAAVAVGSAWMIESRLGPRAEATFVAALAAGEMAPVHTGGADRPDVGAPVPERSTVAPRRPQEAGRCMAPLALIPPGETRDTWPGRTRPPACGRPTPWP